MSDTTTISRYHLAKQHDGNGWMLLKLDAIGTGWPAKARVVECNLSEPIARQRLAELRATERS